MTETKYPYAPHGYLSAVGVDFKGLDVPTGTQVFYRIADWVCDKGGSGLVAPWMIEPAAFLYHIVFGCDAKLKTVTAAKERRAWERLRQKHTDMAYHLWRQIWQTVAENIPVPCGKTAADEICVLFGEYDKALLVGKNTRRKKQAYDFELSDLPD